MRTALVTGGTIRLGKAIADRLRADGWRVLVSSHRPEAGADIVADLSDPAGAVRLYAAALRLLDGEPPCALVNNAALFVGSADAIRAVNLEAPKKLITLMAGRENGMGAVVNVLDSKALAATGASTPYLDAKRTLRDETMRAAQFFAATLRVNAVAPGPVLAPTAVRGEPAGEMLLDRRPTAEDVAAAVAYLLAAEAVTGAILPVDAGQHLLP